MTQLSDFKVYAIAHTNICTIELYHEPYIHQLNQSYQNIVISS